MMIHDETQCTLGEGPLWHPTRQQLFWFDIIGKRLHTTGRHWDFDEHVSAAGWVDHDRLLIASETQLFTFDLAQEEETYLCGLESDNPMTRSNDGRADPQGGFWIGTMGKNAEENAGAIYRYYDGTLRKLVRNVTIPNAICFSPDGTTAYYCDTHVGKLMATSLDADGWPVGTARRVMDLSTEPFGIDGAVVCADGTIWNAQWGAGRVAQYSPDGTFLKAIPLPAKHSTCPSFGGPDMTTLFCTSATQGIAAPKADDGKVFSVPTNTIGQKEHQVIL